MTDWLGLEGAKVLIAGAGGFGRTLAAAYAEAGCAVVVADRDSGSLERLPQGPPGRVSAIEADLSTPGECERVVEEAAYQLGGMDVFVHAIGTNRRTSIEVTTEDDWNVILKVNLASAFWFGRAVGRVMSEGGIGGKIVFFSSVSAHLAHPHHGAYAASKGGLNQLLKVMAVEWAPRGIAVNGVAPGYTLTPLTEAYCRQPGVLDGLLARVPMGRLGTTEDLVGPTMFLSSRRSEFMTGQVLYVDGGRTLD